MGREFEPLRGHKAVAEKWLLFYFCRPQAVAYLQHASARTGLWKSVVAPRRWTYRCGTVLSMSIKWRGQPPKGGCINQEKYFCKKFCIGDFGKVESAESQPSWRSRSYLPEASFYNRSSAVFPSAQHLSTTALRRFFLRAASLYNSPSGVLEDNRRYYFYCV